MGFFVKTAIVKVFNAEYLGLTSVLSSILQVLNMAELGFSTAVVVSLYRPINDNDIPMIRGILSYYRSAYRIIGIIVFAGGLLVLPFFPMFLGSSSNLKINVYLVYMIYVMNSAISYFLFAYKEALLNAVQRFDITKKVFVGITLLRDGCQLIAIVVFRNFYLFAFVMLGCTVIYSVLLQVITQKKYRDYYPEGQIDEGSRKDIRMQIAGLSIGKVLGISRNSLDTLIISSFLGLTIVGQYNNYFYIFSTLISVAWVIIGAVQSSVGNSLVSETKEKNFHDLMKMECLFSIMLSVATACLFTLYQPFMRIWMGQSMVFNDRVMYLFVIYFYAMGINGVRNAYFFALGLWWRAKWILISEATLNLILNVLLGKIFGIYGVLFATIITIIFLNYLGITKLLFREYFIFGFKKYLINRVYYTIITISICIVAKVACSFVTDTGYMGLIERLIITLIISGGLVMTVLYLFYKEQFYIAIDFTKKILNAEKGV